MLWLFAALLLITLVLSFLSYRSTFYSPHRGQNDVTRLPRLYGKDYEEEMVRARLNTLLSAPYDSVMITSYDGLKLKARLIPGRDESVPLILCFHGYRSNPFRDFCGSAPDLLERGYGLLLVEERAHGESEGHTLTYGVMEREDCHAWAYAAAAIFPGRPLILFGTSMGAATVLLASSMDLPAQVKGIIADSGYTSGTAIIKDYCRRKRILWSYPFAFLGALLFGHFSLTQADVLASVREAKRPLLLLHGEEDRLVPVSMGRELAAANASAAFHTFPQAGHILSCFCDGERYMRLLTEFIGSCLKDEP